LLTDTIICNRIDERDIEYDMLSDQGAFVHLDIYQTVTNEKVRYNINEQMLGLKENNLWLFELINKFFKYIVIDSYKLVFYCKSF
jgi:hypothetical protein